MKILAGGAAVAVGAATLLVLVVYSVGGDDDRVAASDETPTTSSTPNATATPVPMREPLPSPIARADADLAPEIWTIIEGVEERDLDTLMSLVTLQQILCVPPEREGLGGPPGCEDGDPEGTVYSVFPASSCHGYWSREPSTLLASLLANAGPLYAVAIPEEPAEPIEHWPAGEIAVVFSPAPDAPTPLTALALYIEDGRIARAAAGCNPAENLIRYQLQGPVLPLLAGPFEP